MEILKPPLFLLLGRPRSRGRTRRGGLSERGDVVGAGETAFPPADVVRADHARLEGDEQRFEIRHARHHDAQALDEERADGSRPSREGAVFRSGATVLEDELSYDGTDHTGRVSEGTRGENVGCLQNPCNETGYDGYLAPRVHLHMSQDGDG